MSLYIVILRWMCLYAGKKTAYSVEVRQAAESFKSFRPPRTTACDKCLMRNEYPVAVDCTDSLYYLPSKSWPKRNRYFIVNMHTRCYSIYTCVIVEVST